MLSRPGRVAVPGAPWVSLSFEILQLLKLEPHNEGADYMLDCGVLWLLRGQKSCGSLQTAVTTSRLVAQHLRVPRVQSSAQLRAPWEGRPVSEMGKWAPAR